MRFNTAINTQSLVYAIDVVSGTNIKTFPLDQKALFLNMGMDIAYGILMESVDTKSYDDPNYTKLPQGNYNIVAGQGNVTVKDDVEGGEILKIYKVFAFNENGEPYELERTDIRSANVSFGTKTGKVSAYDWVGTSLVFDVIPEADIANGIKVFYMRNSTYFVGTDTEKEVGLPATLVPGLIDYASWRRSFTKGLNKKSELKASVDQWKIDLANFASSQSIEQNTRLRVHRVNAE